MAEFMLLRFPFICELFKIWLIMDVFESKTHFLSSRYEDGIDAGSSPFT